MNLKILYADPREPRPVLRTQGIEPHPGPTTRDDLRRAAQQQTRSDEAARTPVEPKYDSPVRQIRLNAYTPLILAIAVDYAYDRKQRGDGDEHEGGTVGDGEEHEGDTVVCPTITHRRWGDRRGSGNLCTTPSPSFR